MRTISVSIIIISIEFHGGGSGNEEGTGSCLVSRMGSIVLHPHATTAARAARPNRVARIIPHPPSSASSTRCRRTATIIPG